MGLKESKDLRLNMCSCKKKKNSIREVKDEVIRRPNVKRKQISDEKLCSRSRSRKGSSRKAHQENGGNLGKAHHN